MIGALNACTGQVSYLQEYIVGRKQVSAFYRQLAEQYARFDKVYVIQDNWNIHTHDDVQATLNQVPHLEAVGLPTYASWLNPIEKLWRWTRQTVLHRHRLADRWDELTQREPFVGAAGKNFDTEIKKHGLDRSHFYICNTVRCHTKDNIKPTQRHMDKCDLFLRMEIGLRRELDQFKKQARPAKPRPARRARR